MAGIQISNLLSDSAFDWKSVVDQLIAADGIPITKLTTQKGTNSDKTAALSDLSTLLNTLQDSASALRDSNLFASRTVSTPSAASTWKSTSSTGATVGTYVFAIQQLATKAQINGTSDVGRGLSATDDVSATTLATLNTATPITAGNFTVNGQQVNVALTDSLEDVFNKIAAATAGPAAVTGSYDAATDRVKLDSSAEIVLGAVNDTSNFLQVMKLGNNGGASVSSASSLGTINPAATIANSGLKTTISGSGTFTINGVSINYDASTDAFSTVMSRINKSGAGVTVSYDALNDRFKLVNNSTGDVGIGMNDATGLLAAMGLAGGSLVHGNNAKFTVNGGAPLTSMSNTLDASAHGISGLSVTVNTEDTQTIDVASDVGSMQTAIQGFIDNFNAVQDYIATNTKVSSTGGTVTTAILSNNREVQTWASKLRSLAFETIGGLSGTVNRLDNLGIDFDVNGKMAIKKPDKLAAALTDHPDDVQTFFQKASTGFVAKTFNYLTSVIHSDLKMQDNLNSANKGIDAQIATLQTRLDAERLQLTNAFIRMLDAQSAAKSQNTALNNAFSSSNDNKN